MNPFRCFHIFIYFSPLSMVRAFQRFCHFTSVPLPLSLSLSFSPANAPHPTLSLYTALSYLFARIFFLRVARFYYFSFLQFLFYFFFAFSFALAWFYCPIRFVKHFTFVAHMNFKFLKMFQSFRSLLLCRCMCV